MRAAPIAIQEKFDSHALTENLRRSAGRTPPATGKIVVKILGDEVLNVSPTDSSTGAYDQATRKKSRLPGHTAP